MNFCGGTIEQQILGTTTPKYNASSSQRRSSHGCANYAYADNNGGYEEPQQPQVDLSVHPSCVVTSCQPQHRTTTTTTTNSSHASFLQLSKKKLSKTNSTPTATSSPTARSRSRSRSQRDTSNSRWKGMEIVTTTTTTSTPAAVVATPPTRLLHNNNNNNTSNNRVGISSFSNMKTLETLLHRLEHGFRVTRHAAGMDPAGQRVFLTLRNERTCLTIAPIDDDTTTTTTTSSTTQFHVKSILRLEIGKTTSNNTTTVANKNSSKSVLSQPKYHPIPPMTCFSIVTKQQQEEVYFDFQATSVIEREALISTLMVVLDQVHNNTTTTTTSPKKKTKVPTSTTTTRMETPPVVSVENSGKPSSRAFRLSDYRLDDYNSVVVNDDEGASVSESHPSKSSGQQQQQHVGTEVRLISPKSSATLRSVQVEERTGPAGAGKSKSKPLRQRHLQPEAVEESSSNDHSQDSPSSPTRQTSRSKYRQVPFRNLKPSPVQSPRQQQQHHPPSEQQDEQRDASEETGSNSIVIMDYTDQPATEIELGLDLGLMGLSTPKNKDDQEEEDDDELSFEINHQGLPVSKLQFSPTNRGNGNDRSNVTSNKTVLDPQEAVSLLCCNLAVADMEQMNTNNNMNNLQPNAWCSDDLCTLALRDMGEMCTGMFEHHPHSYPTVDHVGSHSDMRPHTEKERAYVEEYIAGVLGAGLVWNADETKPAQKDKQQLKANRIQNRASRMNAQARRLRTLRNDMTFAAAFKRSKEKMVFVQTTKSFDDAESDGIRQAQEQSMSMVHSSALMDRVMGTTANAAAEDEDVLFYDSDPEDVRTRTRGGVRRASANRGNLVDNDAENSYKKRAILSGAGFESIAVSRKLRKLDEGLIVQLVQVRANSVDLPCKSILLNSFFIAHPFLYLLINRLCGMRVLR